MAKRARSPCINNCILTRDDVCVGCSRTYEEIAEWSDMTKKQKLKVLERIELIKKEAPE